MPLLIDRLPAAHATPSFTAAPKRILSATPSFRPSASLREIDALADLGPDWDGYDASPIAPKAITSARSIAEHFEDECWRQGFDIPEAVISPTPEGGVRIDWKNRSARYDIAIDIPAAADRVSLLFRTPADLVSRRPLRSTADAAKQAFTLWVELTDRYGR